MQNRAITGRIAMTIILYSTAGIFNTVTVTGSRTRKVEVRHAQRGAGAWRLGHSELRNNV